MVAGAPSSGVATASIIWIVTGEVIGGLSGGNTKDSYDREPLTARCDQLGAYENVKVSKRVFDFKGVIAGQETTPEMIRQKLGVGCGTGYGGSYICNGTVTIAQAVAQMNLVINARGTVQRITLDFPETDYDAVGMAMASKFGRPTRLKNSIVSNRLGAQFQQVISDWTGSGSYVQMMRYAGAVDRSSVIFYSDEEVEARRGSAATQNADM